MSPARGKILFACQANHAHRSFLPRPSAANPWFLSQNVSVGSRFTSASEITERWSALSSTRCSNFALRSAAWGPGLRQGLRRAPQATPPQLHQSGLSVPMQSKDVPRVAGRLPIGVGLPLAGRPQGSFEAGPVGERRPYTQSPRYGLVPASVGSKFAPAALGPCG